METAEMIILAHLAGPGIHIFSTYKLDIRNFGCLPAVIQYRSKIFNSS